MFQFFNFVQWYFILNKPLGIRFVKSSLRSLMPSDKSSIANTDPPRPLRPAYVRGLPSTVSPESFTGEIVADRVVDRDSEIEEPIQQEVTVRKNWINRIKVMPTSSGAKFSGFYKSYGRMILIVLFMIIIILFMIYISNLSK